MELTQVIYAKENGVATLTLNRPEVLNALSNVMIEELLWIFEDAKRDTEIKVVVVTGAGRAFCAGADVKGLASNKADDSRRIYSQVTSAADARNHGNITIQRLPRALEAFPKPLIAAVNGPAIGGGMDFASMCDIRFASDKARFGMTHTKVGRPSMDGGLYFLPRIIGVSKTLELIWSARIFDAEEALRIGYINRLVPHDQLLAEANAFALMLAQGPSVAIEMCKRLVYNAPDFSLIQALKEVELAAAICHATEDAVEGPKAIAEKRPPKFKGR